MKLPRVRLMPGDECEQVSQSEEHLVLRCGDDDRYQVGDSLYAVPVHICPTVSKYARAQVVENQRVTGSWNIEARDHDNE